ncbi:MAG: hypothetical protein ACRDH5_14085, partial [bacterium]
VLIVVAWPADKGATGNRAFVMDAFGAVHACGNGPYEGRGAPPPDVLHSQEQNLASSPRTAGTAPRDGCLWERIR